MSTRLKLLTGVRPRRKVPIYQRYIARSKESCLDPTITAAHPSASAFSVHAAGLMPRDPPTGPSVVSDAASDAVSDAASGAASVASARLQASASSVAVTA